MVRWPEVRECSGNGAQVDGVCVCEDGWGAAGDFWVRTDDCDINDSAIRVMWSICLVQSGFALFYTIFHLRRNAQSNSALRTVRGMLSDQKGQIYAIFLASTFIWLVFGSVKIATGGNVGFDPAISILFGLGTTAFFTGALMYMMTWIKITVSRARMRGAEAKAKMQDVLQKMQRLFWRWLWPMVVLSALAPICMLGVQDTDSTDAPGPRLAFAIVHWQGLAVVMACCCAVFVHFGRMVLNAMDESINHSSGEKSSSSDASPSPSPAVKRMADARKRVALFRRELISQTAQQCLIATLMCYWPWLRVKAPYQIAFAWCIAAFVSMAGIWLITRGDSSGKRGSGRRVAAGSSFSSAAYSSSVESSSLSASQNKGEEEKKKGREEEENAEGGEDATTAAAASENDEAGKPQPNSRSSIVVDRYGGGSMMPRASVYNPDKTYVGHGELDTAGNAGGAE